MNATMLEKFKSIIDWYSKNNPEETRQLVTQPDGAKLERLKALIEKQLPAEFIDLYSHVNGESGLGMGIFLAHSFLSLEEITHAIELSKTFVKPATREIVNPSRSAELVNELVAHFTAAIPKGTSWYKIEFMCAPNSISYPYYYADQDTPEHEKTMFEWDFEKENDLLRIVKELHDLEHVGYNWDELHGTVLKDGTQYIERKDFSFLTDTAFTSFPEGAIKKTYFNPHWVPVIFDNLGNYIGFDLDPDVNGKTGQVIVFGRDEEEMFVLADSFEGFLDFSQSLIDNNTGLFLEGRHLHDIYKPIILAKGST